MLKEAITEKAFFERYRGQPYRRIATPANYPYIYLFFTEGRTDFDNLDVDGDGSNNTVYFSSEGEGNEVRGNKAISEHAKRKNVYHSLLLFQVENEYVNYVGEYFLAEKYLNPETGKIAYFELKKVPVDLEEVQIFHVEKKVGAGHVISEIKDRDDYFLGLDEKVKIDQVVYTLDASVEEGDYVDANYQTIYVNTVIDNEATKEEKKVAQHKNILENYNNEIRKHMRAYKKEREAHVAALESEDEGQKISNIILFCVNVGCGLTSFLVLEKDDSSFNEVWCFDWGKEKSGGAVYSNNIEECLNDIHADYFNNQEIKITKFFLSHPHADHYQETQVDYLEDSEIWINPCIHDGRIAYLNLLSELLKKTTKFVEPICDNSMGNITVLHPNKSIEYHFQGTKVSGGYYTSNPNNVSPLIKIDINDTSIVLVGDIEHQGWNWYKKAGGGKLMDITVFIHSHHGSETGFLTDIPNRGDTEYETIDSDIDVLSSRDGAYSGIVSAAMKAHAFFAGTWKTENPNPIKYLKINLLMGSVDEVR